MKNSCTKMLDSRFTLCGYGTDAFVPGPRSDTLWIDYEGRVPEKAVAKNALVYPGMLLARHPDPGMGDLHCPVVGVVTDPGAKGVLVTLGMPKPKPVKNAAGEMVTPEPPAVPVTEPVALAGVSDTELPATLKLLGIDTGILTKEAETLIINGLNPEPGITWAEPMLATQAEVLTAGIVMLRRLSPAKRFVLAVSEGVNCQLQNLDVSHVPGGYPASLDPLVIKAVTGEECPQNVNIVGLHAVWGLGRVAQSGLPLTETVLTLNGINYIVELGTPVRVLLETAGIKVSDGDWVVFGGPMRGKAQDRLQSGVTRDVYGVVVVAGDAVPSLDGDAACVSCGACVHVCPARLQPDMLSKNAEFGRYEKCRDLHIDVCMDCGLCTYVCIARRPVMQHIRMARKHLADLDRAAAAEAAAAANAGTDTASGEK